MGELIKIRLQTANSNIGAMGVNSGLANLTAIGMFRGLGATCIHCGFGNAGFFAYLEAVDLHREKQQPPSDLQGWGNFIDAIHGGISGSVYWIICLPFDVIKSRQQASMGSSSMISEVRKIVYYEGVSGLWRGLSLAMYRAVPMQAAIYCVYKVFKDFRCE